MWTSSGIGATIVPMIALASRFRLPPPSIDVTHTLRICVLGMSTAAALAACSTSSPSPAADTTAKDEIHTVSAPPDPEPKPPPFIDPPPPTVESWEIPGYGQYEPPFPYLPDESRQVSRSVGTVTDGHLVGGQSLPLPHPHLRVLPRQFERYLLYAGTPMIELVVDAANHVGDEFPDSTVPVGNFSARGGGDIPHSVSHNSGRDADIGFFVTDEYGEPASAPDLLSMDEQGRFVGAELDETDYPELVLHFDVTRNWRLVEGLIESEAADLQYIFVSRPLRQMLLDEGRRQDTSTHILQIARSVLVQPSNSQPHDDHFHVRIHCTPRDVASGCRETGRPGPTHRPDITQAARTVDRATDLLDDDDPRWRRTAVQRLALLDDHHDQHRRFIELLDDPDARVRAVAARALRDYPPAVEALETALEKETAPRAFAEVVDALAHHGPQTAPTLLTALERDQHIDFGPTGAISTTALVADALARLEYAEAVPKLIDALATDDRAERVAIAHALRLLTNHRFGSSDALRDDRQFEAVVDAWSQWWSEYGELERRQWLVAGFQRAGFDVEDLDTTDVWELCRAISDTHHLNFNAQRVLKRLSGQSPGSLQWDPYDANFYWRRWFERRQDALQLPPIPAELSTADGYTKPP